VSGASVFKGVAGFGVTTMCIRLPFVELSDHLPVKVEFIEIDEGEGGRTLLGKLTELAARG